jgi:hypothetical protein
MAGNRVLPHDAGGMTFGALDEPTAGRLIKPEGPASTGRRAMLH